jgi:hypothetical protein
MKKIQAPRFTEPLAAALMGAGFFIFASALAGGPFWAFAEERLWARLQRPLPPAPALAVFVRGQGREQLSSGERRQALARDIERLALAAPKAIVLEAWLDDASQAESEELLSDLLGSTKDLPKKSAKSLQKTVGALKARLNADSGLATAMARAGHLLLPAAAEPAPAMSPLSGTVWEEAHGYEVLVKGKGVRRLEGAWRASRAPVAAFRRAGDGLALVPAPQACPPGAPCEAQAIFQVRGRWVNGLGFEAARRALDVPPKGLHFLWRDGRLNALELKGNRYPISPRGSLWLPRPAERAQLPALELSALDTPAGLAALKDKVVFFQPWPGLLVGEEAFARQRELCAGILAGRVQAEPEGASQLGMLLGIWLATALALLWLGAWLAPLLGLGIGAALCVQFMQVQAPLARPLGAWSSALLCGLGLRLLLASRRREARRVWLRSHIPPSAQRLWEKLLPDPAAGNTVTGLYLALQPSPGLAAGTWTPWARRWNAFFELGSEAGFFIPLAAEAPYPLDALRELKALAPGVRAGLARGSARLEAELIFDSVRLSLSGNPKIEAQALLEFAKNPGFYVAEHDYLEIRQHVKIQLVGEMKGTASKIFHIIEII